LSVEQVDHTLRAEWQLPTLVADAMSSLNQIISAGYAAGISQDVTELLGRKPYTFKEFVSAHAAQWQ
jgi:hypothetical protein